MLMHIFCGVGMWIFSFLRGRRAASTESCFFPANSAAMLLHIPRLPSPVHIFHTVHNSKNGDRFSPSP